MVRSIILAVHPNHALDIHSDYRFRSVRLTSSSRHCPFEPCIGQMQRLLIQVSNTDIIFSALSIITMLWKYAVVTNPGRYSTSSLLAHTHKMGTCGGAVSNRQTCEKHDREAWQPCPSFYQLKIYSAKHTHAVQFVGQRSL